MKMKRLLLLCFAPLLIPNVSQAIEVCDDEEEIANGHTECDIMQYESYKEFERYQHELETPISYEAPEGTYEVLAFDVIVGTDKDIEIHIFYNLTLDGESMDGEYLYSNINARQGEENATPHTNTPMSRLDDYNDYRQIIVPSEIHSSDTIQAARVLKLVDYETPVTLFYIDYEMDENGKITHSEEVELGTFDFNEELDFSDERDETVEISDGEGIIETRNVYIDILEAERNDDRVTVKYQATAKTRYNRERLINDRYIILKQETEPGSFVTLDRMTDTPYEDDLDKDLNFNGIKIGDTSEIVKVVELVDDSSPLTLDIIDIPSGKVVHTEDLSHLLEEE